MDVPPSVLRAGRPFLRRIATESDGARLLVDAVPCCAPSEPMVDLVAMDDVHRLRTVALDGDRLREFQRPVGQGIDDADRSFSRQQFLDHVSHDLRAPAAGQNSEGAAVAQP